MKRKNVHNKMKICEGRLEVLRFVSNVLLNLWLVRYLQLLLIH